MKKSGNNSGHFWKVTYHEAVFKLDIPRLGKTESVRIKRAIENKIAIDPTLYGTPLRGTLKQYWKLRVGNYRIVYMIVMQEVRILVIAHRRFVYELADKRNF